MKIHLIIYGLFCTLLSAVPVTAADVVETGAMTDVTEVTEGSAMASTTDFFSNYSYTFITEASGLPNNYVDDVYCDSDGYVWVATHDGIGRYNGYGFEHFDTTTSPIRLKSDFVRKVCEDAYHRLWVATEEGITLIDLYTYTPVLLEGMDVELEKLMNSNISTLYRDKQNHLWVASDKNLWCIEFHADGSVKATFRFQEELATPVQSIIDLEWCMAAGIGNNVCRVRKSGTDRLKAEPLSDLLAPFTEDWRILCMEQDGEFLWIGTNRGLFKYNHTRRTVQRYRYSNHRSGMLSQAYITDVKLTANGHLVVSTLNGLNVYHREEDSFSYIRQNNDLPDKSLNCNFINCLLVIGESIWCGTEIGGLNLLTLNSLKTSVWQYSYLRETSLSPNPANAIAEDNAGNLWVGTVEGGLNKKARGSNAFIHYTFNKGDDSSLSHNSIRGLLIDSDNHLWAYTWGVGINELNLNIPGNRNFVRHLREDSLGLEGDFLSCACEDTLNNALWFGTTHGLHYYNKASKRFTRVLFDKSDNEFESVGGVIIDRKHRLWLGTSEGLFVMRLSTFREEEADRFAYTYLRYKLTGPSSTELEKINCIIEDNEGTIWLGANGNGLYRLAQDNDSTFVFANYTRRDGLPNNTVIGMVEDKAGRLWMSTNYGISCLDTRTLVFTNYTKEDGLPTNHFYPNAHYYSSMDNLLYFGTINGLVAFSPDVMPAKENAAVVSLTSFEVAGTTVFPPADDMAVGSFRPVAGRLDVHERDRSFAIAFSTLNYGNCNRVNYAYRLKGYEEEWNTSSQGEHTAIYHSVPAGSYLFQVCATDEKGHWSRHITTLRVDITPYFYKTWWFYLLIVAMTVVVIRYFYRWKTRLLRQQKKELEAMLREQQVPQEADANDSLLADSAFPPHSHEEQVSEASVLPPFVFSFPLENPEHDFAFVAAAIRLMEENYANPEYNLERFVRDMGYSKTLVNQKLQAYIGLSIGQFMKSYRLQLAHHMFESAKEHVAVAEVAYAVGFNDPKYFTKCFKEQFSMLPSMFLERK